MNHPRATRARHATLDGEARALAAEQALAGAANFAAAAAADEYRGAREAVLAARGDSGHGHACGHADSDKVCARAPWRAHTHTVLSPLHH